MRKLGLYLGTLSKYFLCNLINRDKDKTAEGKDIEITFEQYLQKVNKRALEERTRRKEAKRKLNQIK